MMELRATIDNVENVKKILKDKAKYNGSYAYKDVIFNNSGEILKLRVYYENNWGTKGALLTNKEQIWQGNVKKDIVKLKMHFNNFENAEKYIKKEFPKAEKTHEYNKKGWEYQIGNAKIFLEDVEGINMVEIESENKSEIYSILNLIKAEKIMTESMAEFMRKIKHPNE